MLEIDVSKLRGEFSLLARVSMPTPGVAALFGRSGCGKSTLVELIAGLLDPDEGRIALDGELLLDSARRVNVPPERRRIGCVFQDARLFPHLSVGGNLDYARRRARGHAFVDQDTVVGLLELGALLQRRAHQLSGGERQRVAIGRALLSQPRLLLLDEPLASLDAGRREEVLPYLERLRDELSIPMVYVSHQFDEVLRLATHLVLIDRGRVLAQGGIGEMSLDPRLRDIVGPDAVGAVVDGEVIGLEGGGLASVRVGRGELRVQARNLKLGARLRVQLLARDIIVSTERPHHLSVRNALHGTVAAVTSDDLESDLIAIDVGGAQVLARVTKAATRELALHAGVTAWALVKSVSLRGHSFRAPAAG